MESIQIKKCNDFKKLFNLRKNNLKQIMSKEVQEMIDNEFDLMEFNLFISSIGKRKIKIANEKVRKLREKVDSGKVDLSEYEDMADEF